MNTQCHSESRRGLCALAFAVLFAAGVMPKAALAQSCYNDDNPNLVKNGDFESGSGTDVKKWTVEWDSSVDQYVFLDRSNPHSGGQDLALGTIDAANDIVQKIKGTTVGQVYTICLWLASSPNPTGGVTSFSVLWNNVSELDLTNSAQFGYQYYAFNVTASGADFLRIRERNKQGFYYLDDVAVQLCSGCGLAPDSSAQKTSKPKPE